MAPRPRRVLIVHKEYGAGWGEDANILAGTFLSPPPRPPRSEEVRFSYSRLRQTAKVPGLQRWDQSDLRRRWRCNLGEVITIRVVDRWSLIRTEGQTWTDSCSNAFEYLCPGCREFKEPPETVKLNLPPAPSKKSATMAVYRWAKAAVFLLFSNALSGIKSNKLQVFQVHDSLSIMKGSNLTLNCTFDLDGVATYKWFKDGCPMNFKSQRYKHRIVPPTPDAFKNRKDASIQMKNVMLFDSGIYLCQIDVMSKGKYNGSGTSVSVHENCGKKIRLQDTQCVDLLWIIVTGGAGFLIIVTLLVVVIVLAQRNKAYALLVRESSSFDSAKEPIPPPRNRKKNHARPKCEDAHLHCHNEGPPKRKRPPPARKNIR
ncbi:uncharacterized protein [Narcine bancroftii]|uniref:uncharacterized protein n=1 Tax=Narcine bancroftii TaxID=1343680 RepID=UPI0038318A47